jgi:FolB domain-containing protein
MDKIILQDIKVMGTCGINPLEKMIKQPFSISATMYLDLEAAGKTDDITQTIDYGPLYERIKKLAESSRFNLIESLAQSVAGLLFEDARIKKAKVKVEKLQARHSTSVFSAMVVIERERKAPDRENAENCEEV